MVNGKILGIAYNVIPVKNIKNLQSGLSITSASTLETIEETT